MDTTDRRSITVVIPCYNRQDSVRAAVESVLAQDYPFFDVIAVDDRSTDRTLDVLGAIRDRRLKVIVNAGPKGAAGARNAGAALAIAPWIAFQDSDDVWRSDKLSKQMSRAIGSDFVAVYCAMDCFEEGKKILRVPNDIVSRHEGDLLRPLLADSFISTQTLIIRSDVFEKIGGMDVDFRALDDWEMMIRVAAEGRIAFIDEVLVEQHLSRNSITRSLESRVKSQIQLLEKHRSLWVHYPEALARHHNRISGGLRQLGRYKEASAHAVAAFQLRPFNWRYGAKAITLRMRDILNTAE